MVKLKSKNLMWRIRMRGRGVIILAVLFVHLAFCCAKASATSSISVNVTDPVGWKISVGHASTTTLPIAVTTSNPNGYSVKLSTVGPSTDLISTKDGTLRIPTLTLPSGQSSVSIDSLNNSYGFSLDGTNFQPVPKTHSDGIVIAETSEPSTETANNHNVVFGINADDSIASGDYKNTFLITVVATDPVNCEAGYICYDGNESDNDAVMTNQEVSSGSSRVNLLAPNFSRAGYGFAGWNTRRDGTGTNYGPNETIDTTDVLSSGLVLYAKWIKSEGTLQDWTGCAELSVGDVLALTDSRDENTYTIVKLPDSGCWMTENLRLDLSKSGENITAENTNNPTTDFLTAINQNPSSSSSFCTDNSSKCVNSIRFNTSSIDPESESYWSAYGGYYNWYTATAGNGLLSNKDPQYMVAGDICPAGWSLPTGYNTSGDLAQLDIALGGSGKNQDVSSEHWRKYPANFVFSGEFNGTQVLTVNETGNYHTASPSTNIYAMNLWMRLTSVRFNSNGSGKTRGNTIRCVFNKHYKVHFDKNTDKEVTGDMPDFTVSANAATKLPLNTLSIGSSNNMGYKFLGWNTAADGSGDSYADGSDITNLASIGETATLYAQWEEYALSNVTVNFGTAGISKIEFLNTDYGSFNVTESGSVVTMVTGKTYQIMANTEANYDFNSWSTTANGTLGSSTTNPTTFVVSGTAGLTVSAEIRTTPLYLQDVTLSDCASAPKVAYDRRDGEAYHIQRLSDNRCWMVDNLRITGDNLDVPLSTANTNMSPNVSFTLPSSGTITDTYGTPMINDSKKGAKPTSYGGGGGDAGVYYNYCAVTAGTICDKNTPNDAEYDICPAGWRLPTGGNGTGELVNLYNSYGGNTTNFRPGFSITFSGWYEAATGNIKEYDSAMYMWSSVHSNSTNKSYAMMSNRSYTNISFGALETNGLAARCVMKATQ